MGCGSSVEDGVKDIGNGVGDVFDDGVDFVEDAYDDGVDFVEDLGRDVEELVEDTYKYVVEPIVDAHIKVVHDITEYSIDAMDFVADDIFGVSGAFELLYNVNDGAEYIAYGIVEGDEKAIAVGAMVAVSVVLTVVSFGGATPLLASSLGALSGLMAGGMGVTMTLMAVGYVALGVYTLYSIALPFAEIGKALKQGGMAGVVEQAQKVRDAMNLAYVNDNINGSMAYWMAGGLLYDAPRAGDIFFNTTGDLNTTKFLGLQNRNSSPDSIVRHANPEVHKVLNVSAGDTFFKI